MCQMWYGGEGLWVQRSGCIEDETVLHGGDQHNTQVVRSLGDRLVLLGSQTGGLGALLFSFGSMGLGRSHFCAVLHDVSHSATEKTKLVVQMALAFLRCQFAIFA